MKKRVDVSWSHACVGACCLWEPGDSSPLAASWDLARYLDFLLLHLREDKQNHNRNNAERASVFSVLKMEPAEELKAPVGVWPPARIPTTN